jgi:allophanate hydrolase subunit 2
VLESLVAGPWTVGPDCDRMGLRLGGRALRMPDAIEPLSVGMTWGAIQVPADGLPIVLLADHQTVGGYPVLAVVTTADRPALGQLRPGQQVRFRLTSIEAAQARWRGAIDSLREAAEALDRDAAWDALSLDARG